MVDTAGNMVLNTILIPILYTRQMVLYRSNTGVNRPFLIDDSPEGGRVNESNWEMLLSRPWSPRGDGGVAGDAG